MFFLNCVTIITVTSCDRVRVTDASGRASCCMAYGTAVIQMNCWTDIIVGLQGLQPMRHL
jgi:hypothetical protein